MKEEMQRQSKHREFNSICAFNEKVEKEKLNSLPNSLFDFVPFGLFSCGIVCRGVHYNANRKHFERHIENTSDARERKNAFQLRFSLRRISILRDQIFDLIFFFARLVERIEKRFSLLTKCKRSKKEEKTVYSKLKAHWTG